MSFELRCHFAKFYGFTRASERLPDAPDKSGGGRLWHGLFERKELVTHHVGSVRRRP